MLDVEITLSDWVFDAIENNHILTLNRRYFLLRKPLERRLYEIARKHCGAQMEWRIGVRTLSEKCGSSSSERSFVECWVSSSMTIPSTIICQTTDF